MLNSVIEQLVSDVFYFITGQRLSQNGFLVKKHSEHLSKLGDLSFPHSPKSWQFYKSDQLNKDELSKVLLKVVNDPQSVVSGASNWKLCLRSAVRIKDRLHLFLDRPHAIRAGLLECINNNTIISIKLKDNTALVQMDPLCENLNCVTSLRLKFLTESIKQLYCVSENCQDERPSIFMTSKSTSESIGSKKILCGAVLNVHTNAKEININADELIRLRQNEMTLIAQHKYGVRVASDYKWKEFLTHLGESAAVFELLQIKPSSAVKINFDCSSGSSRGASFVLYNCARLETMLRTYNEKVVQGIYPPLPRVEDVDFTLLNEEDEWCLVYNFVLGLPLMLRQCVEIKEGTCEFRPHLICTYLSCMVSVFSQYYRRVRILTEPRPHLLPVMFARLHLITTLNETLKTCLKILNIKSVTQM